MLLFYSTLYDFTHDHQDVNVKIEKLLNDRQILMRAESFDKPDNFFAEIILPELTVKKNVGFTEDDIIEIRVFLLRNESIIREMADELPVPPNKDLNYYLSLPYPFTVIPDKEDGGWAAYYPDLPGCITCADSWDELLYMTTDAKKCWLSASLEDGDPVPEPEEDE